MKREEKPTGLIFGRTWEQIQQMQQGTYRPKTAPLDEIVHRAQIMGDVQKFSMPVHDDVKRHYNLELPASYVLVDDTWRHQE